MDLVAIAAALAARFDEHALHLGPERDRSYVRLLATPEYEAWLIAWAPAGTLDLHDHGGSAGAVSVVSGRLEERYTDPERSPRVHIRHLDTGRSVPVPATRIHEVSNPGDAVALSVHVYSPPLAAMTFFTHDVDGSVVPAQTVASEV